MNSFICRGTAIFLLSFVVQNNAAAQSVDAEAEESSTAILDTSIPFAIGAREGEQTIRSSFGWPTFQEGFVEGVYFRFDPDGYARFSASPRLDEEVFEVICQNVSTVCVAQKNGMEIGLNEQGNVHFKISGITPDDKFYISDRKSELPIPNPIIAPVDNRFEALLSSGGDLIIRRQLETLQEIPLSGYLATVTYLRWVAQNQASFVFPIGWPVPSQQTKRDENIVAGSELWSDSNRLSKATFTENNVNSVRSNRRQALSGHAANNNGSVTQIKSIVPRKYELSDIGFVEQAQGRNLPADINKFSISQDRYTQLSANPLSNNAGELEVKLSRIEEILANIEIKLENIETRISYELQGLKTLGDQPEVKSRTTYQSLNRNGTDELARANIPQVPIWGEDEASRLIIEAIIQKSREASKLSPNLQIEAPSGEIPIKKNIVERLLEELNGPKQSIIAPTDKAPIKPAEFISLSDYINNVIQDEQLR